MKKAYNENLTVPNALSLLRIILVPFIAYFYLHDRLNVAATLLVSSGLSDLLDGWIARRFNQITELGKMLDPLADKITQGTVAICLGVRMKEIRLVLAIFIVKELVMLIGVLVLIKKKKKPCSAQWFGKVATTAFYLSMIAIFILDMGNLDNHQLLLGASKVLLTVTALLMIHALIRYFIIFVDILRSTDSQYDFDWKTAFTKKKEPKDRMPE